MVFNATFNNISVLSDHYRIYLILNTSKFYNVYVYYIFISRFQFLWMTDTETINSIIMSFTSAPVMIVLDPDTHYFYMPPFSLLYIYIPTNENIVHIYIIEFTSIQNEVYSIMI
jgi:hypothetical protein